MDVTLESTSHQALPQNGTSSSSQQDEKAKATSTAPVPAPNSFNEQGELMSMKEELFRLQFVIPEYLRVAMAKAVESKLDEYPSTDAPPTQGQKAPIHPLIVMINSKSGGRQGPALSSMLQQVLSKEQVFDLSVTRPEHFFDRGLRCLERLAGEDQCAKETRNNLRIIVAGGDGTVGWVLSSMTILHVEQRLPIPPVGIIPLGTGNDLARSLGWGGSFWFAWQSIVRRYLSKAGGSQTVEMDSWQVTVRTRSAEKVKLPHALHPQVHTPLPAEGSSSGGSSDFNAASFEGVFYNYFSIGMDAQVAYGFHTLREKSPHLAQGPISNKLVYSSCSCVQGWFCTPCSANPRARGLRNVMRLQVKRQLSGGWEPLDLPQNVRAVVMLNLQSYASGRNPWGHPDNEYNEKKGFVEPSFNDGLLEIFGLFDGWHASLVMLSLRSAKRLAQVCAIQMQLVADQRHRVYMQMDGEPWRQPLSEDENSTIIDISRVPTCSLMLKAT